MNRSVKKFAPLAILFFIIVAAGAGCAKPSSSLATNNNSYLSVINEATYTGTTQLYFGSTLITVQQGIAAGTYSTQYGTIAPGIYDVRFISATADTVMGLIPQATFDTANFYTLVVYNPAGAGSASQAMKVWDDFSNLTSMVATYRFFNLCPDYPNVDVYLNNNLVQAGRMTADNASNPTLNGFQTINGGNYTITIKKAGTDSVISTLNTGMAQGNAYTVFLGGNLKSQYTPVQINVLQASY